MFVCLSLNTTKVMLFSKKVAFFYFFFAVMVSHSEMNPTKKEAQKPPFHLCE